MASIVNNDKGFKVICLSPIEAFKLGWGNICMRCNGKVHKELYYIAVLNDVMCKYCYKEWLEEAKHYSEDTPIENRNFEYYKAELML